MLRRIDIALENSRRLDLIGNSIQTRGQRGRIGEIGIAIGAGHATLDAQTVTMTDHAETRRPIVMAPGNPRRRPGTSLVTFIGIDRRRVKDHHFG